MRSADITVVIPSIPVRPNALAHAVKSVGVQTLKAAAISIAIDAQREGSAVTRNRALATVDTHWVAFLDDDDIISPKHLETLYDAATRENADVVYSGCVVTNAQGREIPRQVEWGRFGEPFDGDMLREKSYIPVTSLVRTDLAKQAKFGPPAGVDTIYDDWGFYLRLLDMGAKFFHEPIVTWLWAHDGKNTSGQPDRW